MSVLRFVLPEDQPRERLDKVLSELMPATSRSTLQRWIEEGRVRVDGLASCRTRDRVAPGLVLEVTPAAPPPTRAVADPTVQFRALYEDEHLLVIDKPAGLVVHPAKGHADGTLVNGLVARYGWDWSEASEAAEADASGMIRPGIVHRIDKDTSGILVVARNERAREGLKAQLAAHEMGRRYVAISVGVPRRATIRSLYGRHPKSRLKWSSLVREGKTAITHFVVLEVFANALAALVECRLETGRTHQIRVHLSEQNKTPILADSLYGRPTSSLQLLEAGRIMARQALHAAELTFCHPVTGAALSFKASLPPDFAQTLEYLRSLPGAL